MRSLVIAALGIGCSAAPADEAIDVPPGPGCTGALGEILVPPAPQIVPITHLAEPLAVPIVRPFETPLPAVAPPTSVTVGMPWGSITELAATEDETGVVSLDASGGLRIWPTLDGRHEPIVVGATGHTQQLSIEHADDLVIARLDNTGTAEIIRVAITGAPLGRFAVASERPLVAVKAVDSGALALRDDGALVGINLIGEVIGTILPDPGQRITTLVTRNHRTLALLSSQEGIVARWIELLPFRWGPTSPRLPAIDPASAALSPDHLTIAVTNALHNKVLVVDLASGKIASKPVDLASGEDGFRRADVIGFLDDGTLAVRHDGIVAWWHDKAHGLVDDTLGMGAVTLTGRHLLGPSQTQLMISSPYETRYLGYRLTSPSHFLPTKGGVLIGGRHSVLRIDHELDVQVSYQLDAHLSDFIPIDAHHVIAMHDNNEIESVDLDDPDSAKHIETAYNGMIAYEPATHLLAVPQHANMEFLRFDPKTGAFDEPTMLELPQDSEDSESVELFDPSAANGIVALVVFRRFEFDGQPRTTDVIAVKSARHGRTPEAAKRRTLTTDEMRRFDTGDRSMFGIEVTTRHKSPDGNYLAELGNGRITLRRTTGEQLWKLPAAGIAELAWSSEGRLLAFGGGVAELDLTTGAFLDRRCGWEFGLWSEPGDDVGFGAELCKLK